MVPKRFSCLVRRGAGWLRVVALLACIAAASGICLGEGTSRKVIARTPPSFPELAKKMHLTGKVKLEVIISPSGAVTSATLLGGNPVFESSAIEAVKQWKFEPAASATKAVIVLEFAGQ